MRSHLAGMGAPGRVLYTVVRAALAGFVRLWLRPDIQGRDHLPRSGAYVLAPVHRSIVDTPISATLTGRRLRFLGKDSLWKNRAAGWFLSSLGGVPVSRGTVDREALRRCIQVVEGGEPLVLFPEGERKSGAVIQPLFDGAVYVAGRTGIPIVPVGIAGSERVMPKGSRFIRPRRVAVIIGEPITVAGSQRGRPTRSAMRHTTDELHTTLQNLFDAAWERLER